MSDNTNGADADQLDNTQLHKLTVAKLKAALDARNIEYPKKILKQELIDLLTTHITAPTTATTTTSSSTATSTSTSNDIQLHDDSNNEKDATVSTHDDTGKEAVDDKEQSVATNYNDTTPTSAALHSSATPSTETSVSEESNEDAAVDSQPVYDAVDENRRHSKRRKVASTDNDTEAECTEVNDVTTSESSDIIESVRQTNKVADEDTDIMEYKIPSSLSHGEQSITPSQQQQQHQQQVQKQTIDLASATSPASASAKPKSSTGQEILNTSNTTSASNDTTPITTATASMATSSESKNDTLNKEDKSALKFYNYTPRDPELLKQRVDVIDIEKGMSMSMHIPMSLSKHSILTSSYSSCRLYQLAGTARVLHANAQEQEAKISFPVLTSTAEN
jgi:hypothetical protein